MLTLKEDSLSLSGFNKANCYEMRCHIERVIYQEKSSPWPTATRNYNLFGSLQRLECHRQSCKPVGRSFPRQISDETAAPPIL